MCSSDAIVVTDPEACHTLDKIRGKYTIILQKINMN